MATPRMTHRNSGIISRFQQQACRFFLIAILLCGFRPGGSSSSLVEAYRIGDYVDAAVSTRSALVIDLFMADRPQFGVSRTVHLPRLPERFSMSFEEGLHVLPYVEAQSLEQLIVTFVYSKSGGGRIHSVASKAIARSSRKFDKSRDIDVVFNWVEEAEVDLESGAAVMFIGALVVSVLFLLQLCTMEFRDNEDHVGQRNNYYDRHYKGR
mmetsp:Transcript_2064/g.5491  ORF Transcript_2064/g.5491 Transcript_2064/m.5491 type:complete len:210 (+) Transcript_2064:62-691(+)|eukprot:CAMPEP_0172371706 /NCGR_PEP_ID=MMETSP1060-20121228/44458_1 /TAXON_ID=37318 /ORGANISM="Pseudo-nitzschia pungens, Strain cf. cingulata" /LENGTH=209 /DNA_ID=CAMNT_0013097427 /DNA_START=54 /DNA_END=683 /DNA_ORIENTATION=+